MLSLLAGAVLPARAHESETPAADTPERAAAVTEVSAAEVTAPKVVVTEIFHRHVGDAPLLMSIREMSKAAALAFREK